MTAFRYASQWRRGEQRSQPSPALFTGLAGSGELASVRLARVATQSAPAVPDSLLGVHTSGTTPSLAQIPAGLSPEEQSFVAAPQQWGQQEMADAMEHGSKPQTVATGQNDLPAGLAAWIVEKYRRWSDGARCFSKDELLVVLTICWATETINSSIRLYYETVRDPGHWGNLVVPVAYLMSPKDVFLTPRSWIECSGRVNCWTEVERGGHFLEWEESGLVADDRRAFLGPLRATAAR